MINIVTVIITKILAVVSITVFVGLGNFASPCCHYDCNCVGDKWRSHLQLAKGAPLLSLNGVQSSYNCYQYIQ